jgi:trk system potassium uptake protein TrkA
MPMYVIIVGGGKVGSYLAGLLMTEGYKVKVIEVRQEEIPRLKRDLPPEVVMLGSGSDPEVLEAAGIRQANVLAAVTGEDEVNLVAASLARFEFRVPRVIGRVNNPRNAWLFTPEMGVDVALNQADLMGHLIAEEMSLGDMITLLKLRKGQFALVEEKVHPTSLAAGKAIRDLPWPQECVLAAILRKGDLIIPKGDVVLQPADEILAVIKESARKELGDLLARRS